MVHSLPPIAFYLPAKDWTGDFPDNATIYWPKFGRGIYAWTLQTYLWLRTTNLPCQLVDRIPDSGIVLAHWDSIPPDLQPGPQQLLVCLQADRPRHAYAQVHIEQNPRAVFQPHYLLGDRLLIPGLDYYLPLWPQPGLIPRDPARGDRFETVAYVGQVVNLVSDFQTPDWSAQLQDLGLQWQIVSDPTRWHDYREIDAILAVRNFQPQNYEWKPATKLYNAWHAGIPAILGADSAFRAERQSDLDYLEVTSVQATLNALQSLRDNPDRRRAMIENGWQRAKQTDSASLTDRWQQLIQSELVPAYDRWRNMPAWQQQLFLQRRSLAVKTKEQRKQLQNWRNVLGVRSRLRSVFGSRK